MAQQLEAHAKELQALEPGPPVTPKNVRPKLLVVRGPDWKWGGEDGGAGKPGSILAVDRKAGTATVYWHDTGSIQNYYRFRKDITDLSIAPACLGLPAAQKQEAKGRRRHSAVAEMFSAVRSLGSSRRNSQTTFSEKTQTIIILDWDDSLFPSTYIREDLRLAWRLPLKDQDMPALQKQEVGNSLAKCAANVEGLLRLADSLGKVVLVTLARDPWVRDSCNHFYPRIRELLEELGVKVVYAGYLDGQTRIDHKKVKTMSDDEVDTYFSNIKGSAIAQEVKGFYSQYDGQSWKNVISIGDSDYERRGTMGAVQEYMVEQGLTADGEEPTAGEGAAASMPAEAEVDGHVYKVRTKTFKMLSEPTIEELTVQVSLMQRWLPLMVNLDSGFDVDLNTLDDPAEIQAIEVKLRGNDPQQVDAH